jgi:hypothetical protein
MEKVESKLQEMTNLWKVWMHSIPYPREGAHTREEAWFIKEQLKHIRARVKKIDAWIGHAHRNMREELKAHQSSGWSAPKIPQRFPWQTST